jgi:hypothetical protein
MSKIKDPFKKGSIEKAKESIKFKQRFIEENKLLTDYAEFERI